MTPISFKSNFIKSASVQKRSQNGNYTDKSVSVVKIDPKNNADIFAVSELPDLWGKKNYVTEISNNLRKVYTYGDYDTPIESYAVTSQTSDFDKLNSRSILGVLQLDTRSDKVNELEYLQINPNSAKTYESNGGGRLYKYVGSLLIDSIKELFPDKKIHVSSAPTAVNFYKNNDFVQTKPVENQDLTWIG